MSKLRTLDPLKVLDVPNPLIDLNELNDIEAPSAQHQRRERVSRWVTDIDHVAAALANECARSKSMAVRELGSRLGRQAQAVRLGVAMALEADRLLAPCEELAATASQLRLLSAKSRVPQGSRLALELLIMLVDRIRGELRPQAAPPV